MTNYYVDMFKIPLLHLEIDSWNHKKHKLKKLFDQKSFSNNLPDEFSSDYRYKLHTGEIDSNNLELENILQDEINSFCDFFGFLEAKIMVNWFQTTINGQYHAIHNHGSYGYTAVCYIDYDHNVHEPTKFIAPFNDFIRGDTLHFFPSDIREGSIIFFPSSINHYAPPNYSEIPRTILSASFKIKAKEQTSDDKIFESLYE